MILEIPISSSAPSLLLSPTETRPAPARSANGCSRAIQTTTSRELAVAVRDIEQGQFASARGHLASADAIRARDVTTALLTAWCYAGQSDLRHALDTLDRIRDPSVFAFRDYHAGLIAALLGNSAEAQRRPEVCVRQR